MTKIASALTLFVTALICLLPAAPAQAAQRDRVFVASYGSDSNPCTFGSPCKTFQNAVNVVAAGGEVTAIDSAGFGTVQITQSVTITSPAGIEAGIAAAEGGTAIYIDAPGATVKLRGLTLEGANAADYGIEFLSGSRIEVVDCAISGFLVGGVVITTDTATTSVLVSNTIATDNNPGDGGVGVSLNPGVSGTITAALDRVTLSNDFVGFSTEMYGNSTGSIEALITDSHIDNNHYAGVETEGGSASNISSTILKNVTLNDDGAGNGGLGIYLLSYSSIWLSKVTQTSVTGFVATSIYFYYGLGGSAIYAYSDGSNHLMGSTFGGGTTPWTPN